MMFHLVRYLHAGVPASAVIIGMSGQPGLLALPPALITMFVLARDRVIRRRVGLGAWPSDGFARHVLVDDLGRLACLTLVGLPLFLIGDMLRRAIAG